MNLYAERSRRGWSQAELARRAGMNASTVGLIESGRLLPYESQLLKLGRALGIPDAEVQTLLNPNGSGERAAGNTTGRRHNTSAHESWRSRGPYNKKGSY
jgi:transcriptional regulator with XRE-family HTH domain